jgi:hypothetical protein
MQENGSLFLSAFPMFVPSLSWQNDPFYMKTDKKHRFPHLSLNFLNVRFELVHTYQASTLRTGGGKQQDKTSCHFFGVCWRNRAENPDG